MIIAIGFILLIIMVIVLRKNNLNAWRSRESILDNNDFSSNRNSHKQNTFSSEDYTQSYHDTLNHQINSNHSHTHSHDFSDSHHHNDTHSHADSSSHDSFGGNDSISDSTSYDTGSSSSNLD